jgi:hypothetical protein
METEGLSERPRVFTVQMETEGLSERLEFPPKEKQKVYLKVLEFVAKEKQKVYLKGLEFLPFKWKQKVYLKGLDQPKKSNWKLE